MEELKPFTEDRPWGWFREFVKNDKTTVKILFVKKGEAFSLQKHQQRNEFWRVLSGNPDIFIGEGKVRAKAGEEFSIVPAIEHRIEASVDDVEVLEIATGEFDEDDIERVEDKYGRA